MLEKLYNIGCLEYQKLIRYLQKGLKISNRTSIVLMTILDNYRENPNINATSIASYMNVSRSEVEESIVELLNLDYIQIQLILKNGKSTEYYRLSPFFKRCERLLSDLKNEAEENDIKYINSTLEEILKRPLTRNELESISSWFDDGKTKEEIIDAIEIVKKTRNVFRFQSINKELYQSQKSISKPDPMIQSMFEKMIKN